MPFFAECHVCLFQVQYILCVIFRKCHYFQMTLLGVFPAGCHFCSLPLCGHTVITFLRKFSYILKFVKHTIYTRFLVRNKMFRNNLLVLVIISAFLHLLHLLTLRKSLFYSPFIYILNDECSKERENKEPEREI